ncbi:MAG: four helix bundle protein [Patescibacteria group bacterium]|jgi:four helix bundle protein
MKINKFEDILAWKLSRELVGQVYSNLKGCRDYGFKDQIQRACISIMNNIAEGFDRKGDREFLRFLKIAKGSCAEVRSMLYVAEDIGYLPSNKVKELYLLSLRINQLIIHLIKYLENHGI